MSVSTQDQRISLHSVGAPAMSQDLQGFLRDTQAQGRSGRFAGGYQGLACGQ